MQKVKIKTFSQIELKYGRKYIEEFTHENKISLHSIADKVIEIDVNNTYSHNVKIDLDLIDYFIENHSDDMSIKFHEKHHTPNYNIPPNIKIPLANELLTCSEKSVEEIPFHEKANIIKTMAKGKLDDFSNKQIIEILKANHFLNSNTTALEISKYKFSI